TVGGHRRLVGLEVDAEMRTLPEGSQPLVDEGRKAAALVLVEEDGALAARRAELLREGGDSLVPGNSLPGRAFAHHRHAQAIRIVESLHRRLSAGTQTAAIERMRRIPFELENA